MNRDPGLEYEIYYNFSEDYNILDLSQHETERVRNDKFTYLHHKATHAEYHAQQVHVIGCWIICRATARWSFIPKKYNATCGTFNSYWRDWLK